MFVLPSCSSDSCSLWFKLFMRWSIRYRVLVPSGLLLLGVVGISTWTALSAAEHAEQRIAAQVRRVAQTLTAASFPLTPNVLEQMKGLSGAEYYLVGPEGVRGSTFPTHSITLPPDELFQLADDPTERLGPAVEVAGKRYRCRRLPLLHRAEGGTLYIFYPEALLQDAIRDAVRPSLVLGLFGGLCAVALAVGIGQRLVGRIRELERRTRLIAAGDFSPMPLPRADDELRDLSRSVNEMASRLAQLQEAVQKTERLRLLGQLSSGLAHQLRNGVAGARLAVQVHAAECPAGDGEALDVALRQLALMEANLRRFMDLGRSEGLKHERCSLTRLIDEAVTLLRPQCRHAGTQLNWKLPESDAIIEGDAGQLGDLFLNVIGNAVEAAGPGGMVEVEARSAERGARSERPDSFSRAPAGSVLAVEVWDTGSGPPVELAARLFEPFVTGKPEGIGLGLAVARQAAEAHGGRITWKREDGRTCFRIELPATSEDIKQKEKHG